MPNGRRNDDSKYDALWCKAEHDRINSSLHNITGPDGHLTKLHKRIDNLWYLLVALGVIGIANLIATLSPK
jgi:hypothetical protein